MSLVLWGCVEVEVRDQRSRARLEGGVHLRGGRSLLKPNELLQQTPQAFGPSSWALGFSWLETEALPHCSPHPCSGGPSFRSFLLSLWPVFIPSLLEPPPDPHCSFPVLRPPRHPSSGSKRRTAFMWLIKFYYICIQDLAAEKHW